MSYKQLYDAVQALPVQEGQKRISTKWLRQKAQDFSEIGRIVEKWSGVIDDTSLRGFYLEGPLGPPIPLKEKEALITIARKVGNDKTWRRLVVAKETMHVFDTDDEKTDTAEKLDRLIRPFSDPMAEPSQQFRSEIKALIRALGVLCREEHRTDFAKKLKEGAISLEVVSASLRLPLAYLRIMFEEDFPDKIIAVLHN